MSKAKVSATVRVNVYKVVSDAVEQGVAYGYNRAHKHVESPSEWEMCDAIEQAIMNALCEVLEFTNE